MGKELHFNEKDNPDAGEYKNRDGTDTGYKPNKVPPKFDAADDPKIGNPHKEAGKGGRQRPGDTEAWNHSPLWDNLGPSKKINQGALLHDSGRTDQYFWVVGAIPGTEHELYVKVEPRFCSTCGWNTSTKGIRKVLRSTLQKMRVVHRDLKKIKPGDLKDISTEHADCPGDPVKHAIQYHNEVGDALLSDVRLALTELNPEG